MILLGSMVASKYLHSRVSRVVSQGVLQSSGVSVLV